MTELRLERLVDDHEASVVLNVGPPAVAMTDDASQQPVVVAERRERDTDQYFTDCSILLTTEWGRDNGTAF